MMAEFVTGPGRALIKHRLEFACQRLIGKRDEYESYNGHVNWVYKVVIVAP